MAAAAPGDRALVLLSALWLFVMLLMLSGMLWLGLQDRKGGVVVNEAVVLGREGLGEDRDG